MSAFDNAKSDKWGMTDTRTASCCGHPVNAHGGVKPNACCDFEKSFEGARWMCLCEEGREDAMRLADVKPPREVYAPDNATPSAPKDVAVTDEVDATTHEREAMEAARKNLRRVDAYVTDMFAWIWQAARRYVPPTSEAEAAPSEAR